MLKTIQIVALVQGVFLLIILFAKRKNYKNLNFWLLFITIISLLLHIVGDDDFNLIQTEANWYIFHAPLIITLFFLLIKYHNSDHKTFQKKDALYFIPYLIFVGLQFTEHRLGVENATMFGIVEGIVGMAMIYYLVTTIVDIVKNKKEQWILFFIVPYMLVYFIDAFAFYINGKHDSIPFLESYGIIGLSGLLLYIILFKLIVSPKAVLPKAEMKAYKTSSLQAAKITDHMNTFVNLMQNDKLYKDATITVNDVAKRMGIPRQHLSEVLNVHMKSSFQDYINKCRAEAFVTCLKDRKYDHYTMIGIANEVGFKSKSSFYTAFKKVYGVTPSEFKKSLSTS